MEDDAAEVRVDGFIEAKKIIKIIVGTLSIRMVDDDSDDDDDEKDDADDNADTWYVNDPAIELLPLKLDYKFQYIFSQRIMGS